MKHLREFLDREIEAFLNYEFGPGMQNMTPEGIRRILWTPEHTARLVGHLAGNWEMVEEALRVADREAGEWDGTFGAKKPFVMRELPIADFGEATADNAQADAAAAEFDATPEDAKPPVNPEVPW